MESASPEEAGGKDRSTGESNERDDIIRLPNLKVHYGTPDVVQMAEAFAQTLGISKEALTQELVASREALQKEFETLLPPSMRLELS